MSCTGPRDCGCPLLCVNDPLSGFSGVCEYPCLQLGDCPNLLTVCKGTSCQLNGCGSGTSNGAFNSFCTVVSGNDGTCQPLSVDAGVVGLCQQGGAATQACNATADRHNLPEACVAGMICIGGGIGSGGVCGDACNPNGPNSCPAGQTCAATVDNPFAGACF